MTKIYIQSIAEMLKQTAQAVEGASREFFLLDGEQFNIARDEFSIWCVCHSLTLLNNMSIRGHNRSIQTFLFAWRSIEEHYLNVFSTMVMDNHIRGFQGSRAQVVVTDTDLVIVG